MDQEKIGTFIAQLRKEKGLTQDGLAFKIPVSRQAVSRWECGKTIPDSQTLLILSEIFDVTVNELLYGERKSQENEEKIENVTLDLYNSNKNKKSIIKWLISILGVIIVVFLVYYFVNLYNSIKVYMVNYNDENIKITDGILTITREKIYFQLGDLEYKSKEKISKLKLYYIEKEKENLICETYNSNITLIDDYQYSEYFDRENIDLIISNLYLNVYFENDKYIVVKLDVIEDYRNDNVFFSKSKNIGKISKNNFIETNLMKNELIIDDIKKKFNKVNDSLYNDTYNYNNKRVESDFFDAESLLSIVVYNNSFIDEEWYYDFRLNTLNYKNYAENGLNYAISGFYNNNTCEYGVCDLNKVDEFYNIFSEILK